MNLPLIFSQLPSEAGRSVIDFLYSPARGAHAGRLAAWVPAGIDPAQPGPARTLAGLLGSAGAELDPGQALHRVALLPQPRLSELARRAAIDTLGWALRRVVRNTELVRLDEWVTQDDWSRVYQASLNHPLADRRLVGDIETLIRALQHVGWHLIERAADTLPRALSLRLLLKCPPVDTASVSAFDSYQSNEADAIVRSYSEWASTAIPDWDKALAALAAPARG